MPAPFASPDRFPRSLPMSRAEFLRLAAASAAGLILGAPAPAAERAPATAMRTRRSPATGNPAAGRRRCRASDARTTGTLTPPNRSSS